MGGSPPPGQPLIDRHLEKVVASVDAVLVELELRTQSLDPSLPFRGSNRDEPNTILIVAELALANSKKVYEGWEGHW